MLGGIGLSWVRMMIRVRSNRERYTRGGMTEGALVCGRYVSYVILMIYGDVSNTRMHIFGIDSWL